MSEEMRVSCRCGEAMREVCADHTDREFVCDRCLTRVELRIITQAIPWAKAPEPLELRVRTMFGAEFYLPAVPAGTTPGEIIKELVAQGAIEPPAAGQAYTMAVRDGNRLRHVDPAQSLDEARVPNGGTLVLVPPTIVCGAVGD